MASLGGELMSPLTTCGRPELHRFAARPAHRWTAGPTGRPSTRSTSRPSQILTGGAWSAWTASLTGRSSSLDRIAAIRSRSAIEGQSAVVELEVGKARFDRGDLASQDAADDRS